MSAHPGPIDASKRMTLAALRGLPLPLGAHADAEGVNFAVFGPDAAALTLALYADARSQEAAAAFPLDATTNRTGDYWHIRISGLQPGAYYAWLAGGHALLDPCAREVSTALWNRARALAGEAVAMRGRVVAEADYDWEGDEPLRLAPERAIIYELHVAGFTRHPSARAQSPGTYLALIELIPYLQALGVTHVELLPVMAFDAQDVPAGTATLGLCNYWGYSPSALFAPHPGYASVPDAARRELRDLVKALHRAGLGVILDVVLNHTAEGGAGGPTLHFKALARRSAYHVDAEGAYVNISGCGNTVNCNHPVTSRLLLECVEYWVREMHVDGLRFDMASVLTRGEDGVARADAWLPGAIEQSPALAHTWLIAEPWDAGGLYQVGDFPRSRYSEWNGRYRDVVRRFVRGDAGLIGQMAQCLTGSSVMYERRGGTPAHSINFITCHDGFTLQDLVTYERKHNEGNGEGNRDGNDANWSSNCGIEGETAHPGILRLRARQVRNFMAILLLSQGVPMLLAGDELLRTQHGNNNAWCQDNEIGWIDWTLVERNADMLRYVRALIALRRRHPALMRTRFLASGTGAPPDNVGEIAWYGATLEEPNWHDPEARVLAFTLAPTAAAESELHVVLNMSARGLHAPLPRRAERRWHLAVDTWRATPDDVIEPARQPLVTAPTVLVHAFSVVVLEGRG